MNSFQQSKIIHQYDIQPNKLDNSKLDNNRYILKLYGNLDYNLQIEDNKSLIIKHCQKDLFLKRMEINEWKFELDQIYDQNKGNFEELFENEIDSNDFIINATSEKIFRNIIFIGEKNESLIDEPYYSFIQNCINSVLKEDDKKESNLKDKLITALYFELSENYLLDYFDDKTVSFKSIPKNLFMEDKIFSSVKYCEFNNSYDKFLSLMEVIKGNVKEIKYKISHLSQKENINSNSELNCSISNKKNKIKFGFEGCSSSEIFSLLITNKNDQSIFSKINFILYKAFEFDFRSKNGYNKYSPSNEDFLNASQGLSNIRESYILKAIRNDFLEGKNLFIFHLPCEIQYISLLNYVLNLKEMRQHKIYKTDLNDNYEMQNENPSDFNSLSDAFNKMNINDISNTSFSKNENNVHISSNININKESISYNDNRNMNESTFSVKDTYFTNSEKKEREIDYERLKKIDNKDAVSALFDIMDEI